MNVPMTIAKPTVTTPIQSETRAPKTMRLNTSRTLPSRPMRCWGWSSGQPSRWMQGALRGLTPSSMPIMRHVRVDGRDDRREERDDDEEAEQERARRCAERWRRMLRSVSRQRLVGVWPASASGTAASGDRWSSVGRRRSGLISRAGPAGRGTRTRRRRAGSRRRRSIATTSDEALDDDVVAAGDRLVDRLARRPVRLKIVSVRTAPDEEAAEREADDRDDREQRVAQAVAADHRVARRRPWRGPCGRSRARARRAGSSGSSGR